MSVLSVLGVTVNGDDYKDEFMTMVADSLKVNRDDPACTYIDAWQHPERAHEYLIVSVWKTEDDLLKWYKSPFHIELRNRGMQGLLKGYFNYQGAVDDSKTHQWKRPG